MADVDERTVGLEPHGSEERAWIGPAAATTLVPLGCANAFDLLEPLEAFVDLSSQIASPLINPLYHAIIT